MSVIVSIARGHNASTTLMVDGEIVFYLEEERLSRRKYDGSPLMGLLNVFNFVNHVDHLVICHTHEYGPELDWTGEDLYTGHLRKLAKGRFDFKTHKVADKHHEMHATCAFKNSGFDTAAVVVADGAGSFLQTDAVDSVIYEFETIFKAKWPLKFDVAYKHMGTDKSIGVKKLDPNLPITLTEYPGYVKAYEAITEYCGFQSIDAGKTMGLSPYGKENPDLPPITRDGWVSRDLFTPDYPNQSAVNIDRFPILQEDVVEINKNKERYKKFGDKEDKAYTQIQKDLAYSVQKATEEGLIDLIRKAHELTGETNICISGGYGLNCVANYKYWKEFPDLNIYVEPVSHDGGTSIGGAVWLNEKIVKSEKPYPKRTSLYYGPQYYPERYLDFDFLKKYEVTDTSYDDVAKLIRSGEIVTIFQGKSEAGPRALGNRSILFDPTIKDGKDIVNKVKNREFFRPFACTIKRENVHEWFDLQGRDETPHMMYAVECLPGVQEKISSVIHVDGTCRIQTLTEDENKHYYKLIDAFEKLSGVPILFNTSFNLGGHPLVETIEDAYATLNSSEIEYLYLPEIQKLVKVPNRLNFMKATSKANAE
jgi:carbamoyltransferase